jgi:hypothetical protein
VNLALLGGFDRRPIGPGWTRETFVAVLGGGAILALPDAPSGVSGPLPFPLGGLAACQACTRAPERPADAPAKADLVESTI